MCEILTKKCSKCGAVKPAVEFSKESRNRKDGLCYNCKECEAKRNKVYKEKNKARETIVMPYSKTCFRCKTTKSALSFTKNSANRDWLDDHCKECKHYRHMKSKHGITDEQIKTALEAQGGACAICKFIPGPGDRPLCLGHDHLTNENRGFLCDSCILGLGHLRNSLDILSKTIKYLNSPNIGILYKKSWGKRGVPKVLREQILASQNGLCKICSVDLSTVRACVDHDHLTNMVRGYLCSGCNSGLGYFDDSVELLQSAIGYLNYHKAKTEALQPSSTPPISLLFRQT